MMDAIGVSALYYSISTYYVYVRPYVEYIDAPLVHGPSQLCWWSSPCLHHDRAPMQMHRRALYWARQAYQDMLTSFRIALFELWPVSLIFRCMGVSVHMQDSE
jgi:hypothetical protein